MTAIRSNMIAALSPVPLSGRPHRSTRPYNRRHMLRTSRGLEALQLARPARRPSSQPVSCSFGDFSLDSGSFQGPDFGSSHHIDPGVDQGQAFGHEQPQQHEPWYQHGSDQHTSQPMTDDMLPYGFMDPWFMGPFDLSADAGHKSQICDLAQAGKPNPSEMPPLSRHLLGSNLSDAGLPWHLVCHGNPSLGRCHSLSRPFS